MIEQYQIAIITGVLTLFGVIVGGLIPFFAEVYRRRWMILDRQYERNKEVLDRRCNQAEEYVQAVTADFRRIMHFAETNYLNPDDHSSIESAEKLRTLKKNLDTKIFSLGPSIRALDDEELKYAWDNMMLAREKLDEAFIKSGKYRFEGDASLEPMQEYNVLLEIWLEFSQHLGNFYRSLDRIRRTYLSKT